MGLKMDNPRAGGFNAKRESMRLDGTRSAAWSLPRASTNGDAWAGRSSPM